MVTVLDVLNEAHGAYVTMRYNEAIPLYEECTRLSPGTAIFYDYLGKAKRKIGDHSGSVEAFKKALAINPDLIDTRLILGIALVNMEDYADAEKELREVIARAPQMDKGYSYLANLYHMQERYADELEQIEAMFQNAELEDEIKIRQFREQKARLQQMLEKN
jgi:predicted Zn-dependent protease